MRLFLAACLLLAGSALVVTGREHVVEVVSSLEAPPLAVQKHQERATPSSDNLYLENKYAFRFSGYPYTAVPFGTTIHLDAEGRLSAKGRQVVLVWNKTPFDTVRAWSEEDLEAFIGPFQQGLNGGVTSEIDGQEGIPIELSPLHPGTPVYTRGVKARQGAQSHPRKQQKEPKGAVEHGHSHFVAVRHKSVHSLKNESLIVGGNAASSGNIAQLGEQGIDKSGASKSAQGGSIESSDGYPTSSNSGESAAEAGNTRGKGDKARGSSNDNTDTTSRNVGGDKASSGGTDEQAKSNKKVSSSPSTPKGKDENSGEHNQQNGEAEDGQISPEKTNTSGEKPVEKSKPSAGTKSEAQAAPQASSDETKGPSNTQKESTTASKDKATNPTSESAPDSKSSGKRNESSKKSSASNNDGKDASNPEAKDSSLSDGKTKSHESKKATTETSSDGKVTTTKTSTTTSSSTTSTSSGAADTGSMSAKSNTKDSGSQKNEMKANAATEKSEDAVPGKEKSVSQEDKSVIPGNQAEETTPENAANSDQSTETDDGEGHPQDEDEEKEREVADSIADQHDDPKKEEELPHSKEYIPPPSARADGNWFDAAGTGLQISTQPDTNEEPSVVLNGVVNDVLYGNGGAGYFLSRNYMLPATFYIWKFKGIPGAGAADQSIGNVTLSDSRNVTGAGVPSQVEEGTTALGEIDSVRITVVNITMQKNVSEGCSAHDATKKTAYEIPLSSSPLEFDVGFSEKCFAERMVSVRVFLGFSDYSSVTFFFTKAIAVAEDVSVTATADTIGQTGDVVESGLSQGPWSGVTEVTATELTDSFSPTSFYIYPSALVGNSSEVFENVEAVSSHSLSCPVDSFSLKHMDGSEGWNLTSPLNLTIHYSSTCSQSEIEVAPVRISVVLVTTSGSIVEWTYLKSVNPKQGDRTAVASEDSKGWAHQKKSMAATVSDTSGERIAASIAALNSRIWVTTNIMEPTERASDVFDGIVKFEYGAEPIATVGPAAATKFFFFARDNSESLIDSLDPAYLGPMVQDLKVSVIPSTASCKVSTSGDLTLSDHMLTSTQASTLVVHYHNCTVTEAVRVHVLVGFEGNKIVEFQYRKISTGAICMSTHRDITQRPDVIDHGLVRSNYGVNSTAVVSPFAKKTEFYLWEPIANSDKTASKVKSVVVKSDILLCHPEVSGSVMNRKELSSEFQTLTITYPMLQCNVTGAVHIAVKITLENGYSFEFQYDKVSSAEAVKRIGEERERRLKSEEKHRQALRVQAAADEARVAEEKQKDEYEDEKQQLRRELKLLVVPVGISLFALLCACVIWVGCDHGKRLLGFLTGEKGETGSGDQENDQIRSRNSHDTHNQKPSKIWKL